MEAILTFPLVFNLFTVAALIDTVPSWLLIVVASILAAILIAVLALLLRAVVELSRAGRRRDGELAQAREEARAAQQQAQRLAQEVEALAEQNATLMQSAERLRSQAPDPESPGTSRGGASTVQESFPPQAQTTQDTITGLVDALREESAERQRQMNDERDLIHLQQDAMENEQRIMAGIAASLDRQTSALSQLSAGMQMSADVSRFAPDRPAGTPSELRNMTDQLRQINIQQSVLLRDLENARRATNRGPKAFSQPAPVSLTLVRFTAYYPDSVVPDKWNGLRVYTHLEDALAAVRADAAQSQAFLGERPTERGAIARGDVRQGDEVTIVPDVDGVEFAPRYAVFSWTQRWQSADFNFRISHETNQPNRSGVIRIFANGIITAEIAISFAIQALADGPAASFEAHEPVEAPCRRFQRVFGSYSHKDGRVVLAYRDFCKARGDDFYLDVDTLKPGQRIDVTLKKLIEQAEIFQLFWSKHSARSKNVRTEWVHALGLNRGEGFVLPVYWQKPFVSPPSELPEDWFKFVPLPKLSMRRWLIYRLFGYAG